MDGPAQMALDEALLALRCEPALRVYCWRRPQITFGYFGSHEQVARKFPGLQVTRRWTGGGVVEHGEDLTFSLLIPSSHPLAGEPGQLLYQKIHQAVASVLEGAGREVRLAEVGRAAPGAECFAAPVAGDVLVGEGKVVGGALRRTRQGLLYQGSLRDPGLQNLPSALRLADSLADRISQTRPTTAELKLADRLEMEKYGNADWLARP